MTLTMAAVLLVALLLGAAGQTFMKAGLNDHGAIASVASLFLALTRTKVIIGLGLYVLSSMLYLTLMSKMSLSILYPMVALNYVFVTILSWYYFGEHVNALRVVALGVIVVGVTLVGLSQDKPATGQERAAALASEPA